MNIIDENTPFQLVSSLIADSIPSEIQVQKQSAPRRPGRLKPTLIILIGGRRKNYTSTAETASKPDFTAF